jgi:hypothetical protein
MVGRFIAMLALEQPAVVGVDDLVAGLKRRVPLLQDEIVGRPYGGDKAAASEAYIVSISGCHYAVAFVGQPAPANTFDAALSYSAESWPDAGAHLGKHQAHVILSNLVFANGFEEAVDAAGSVTLIAGVLNELTPSLGVYWANGETLLPNDDFDAMTEMLITGDPPVGAWINIHDHTDGDRTDSAAAAGVSTLGLDSFCGREIESGVSPSGLSKARERVLAVTADILRNGPGLADNSTLKIGEDETITVNLAEFGSFRTGQPVIRLTPIEPEVEQATPEPASLDEQASASDEPPLFTRRRRAKQFAT